MQAPAEAPAPAAPHVDPPPSAAGAADALTLQPDEVQTLLDTLPPRPDEVPATALRPERHLARCHENERWFPVKGWSANLLPTDLCGPWSDEHGRKLEGGRDGYPLPAGALHWDTEWLQDTEAEAGVDGWCYARNFALAGWRTEETKGRVVRRRAWVRAYLVGRGQEVGGSAPAPPTPVAAAEPDAVHDALHDMDL